MARERLRIVTIVCTLWGSSLATGAWAKESVDDLLNHANDQLAMFNWDNAYRLYGDTLAAAEKESPGPWSAKAQQAAFGKAVATSQASPSSAERIDEATSLFNRLADAQLKSPFAARSMMNLGRLAELSDFMDDRVDIESARKRYAEVVERFPSEPIAAEATYRIAGTYVQSFKPEDLNRGAEICQAWITAHPKDPLNSAMWQYAGDAYFFLKEYRRSLDAYMESDKLGWTDEGNQGPIYWRMAVIADRELKDTAAAGKFYTKIIVETPYSGKAYESQLALKRLGMPVPEIQIFKVPTAQPTTAPVAAVSAEGVR